jgi:hypothetical protein
VVKNPQKPSETVSLITHPGQQLAQGTVEKIDFFVQLRDGMRVALRKVPKTN